MLATEPRGLRGGRSSLGRGGSDVCGRAGPGAHVGRWWAARGGRSGERDVYLEVVFGVGSLRLERGGARLLAVDARGVERRVRIDREREGVDRLGEANRRG